MNYLKTIIHSILTFAFAFSFLSASAHFGSKGPYGGSVSCSIAYDTTVYIGTSNGGVFESTSSKLVGWRSRPVGLKSGKITALAHSGVDLYAATADKGIYIFNGYVGSDRYWKEINTGLTNLKIKSLLAIDSVTLLAGTDGDGVFKSVNKGATWVSVAQGWVITSFVKAGNNIFLTAYNGGVFISKDKGNTWSDFNDVNTLHINGTRSLSYNETTAELAVVNGIGIYKTSIDASNPVASYSLITTGLPSLVENRFLSNNGTAWLLATDKGIFITPANSVNWTVVNTGLTTLDVQTITTFQNSAVAGTNGEGIFKTSLASSTWVANNFGFNNIAIYSMACSGVAVLAAATEKGIFVSKDLGNTYKKVNTGIADSLQVNDITFWGSKLIAATTIGGIFISTDTGATWTPFNTGLSINWILKVNATANYIYAIDGLGGVFYSLGSTWTRAMTGLPNGVKSYSLAFSADHVALATLETGVYVSRLGETVWHAFNNGLMNLKITSVVYQHNKLFAGTQGDGVFVTDTIAADWKSTAPTAISHTTLMGLNGNSIQAMSTYGGYIFASYKGGVLATSDNGATWIAAGNQFNLPSYSDVKKIEFVTTRIFVTTENNGLYSNALSELPNAINEQASMIGTFQMYPNPSDGNFNLDLQPIKGEVKQVIVYDQGGKKITTLRPSSSLIVSLYLPEIAGIYYVQVITKEGTTAQKIIIK